ncbi:MAG: PDDEXK nuclease domain-containing protein [Sulfurimonas sp.]|nr:PDDEXK nuclease domain-containing protein [Sulfurimonas sp.]
MSKKLQNNNAILNEVKSLIEQSKSQIATTVNSAISLLYWEIGNRINKEVLQDKRAEYGKQIVDTLAKQLTLEYGRGFTVKNLRHMMKFAEVFSDKQIVLSLIRQLSWTHFISLIYLKQALQRDFYAQMCCVESWNTRTLKKKIDSMLFERTAISKKPEILIEKELALLSDENTLTPELVFRDPYFLDFLGLKGAFQEKDLESAILRDIESFIMELGIGFTFVERQKRIIVDEDNYYIDLLFYHRYLQRLVVIELKLGDFKPTHKGQMELYLRWLDKYERQPSEKSPIGIILCTGKKQENIQLLELDKSSIHVAEYLLELPSIEKLKEKLTKAVETAQNSITKKEIGKDYE